MVCGCIMLLRAHAYAYWYIKGGAAGVGGFAIECMHAWVHARRERAIRLLHAHKYKRMLVERVHIRLCFAIRYL